MNDALGRYFFPEPGVRSGKGQARHVLGIAATAGIAWHESANAPHRLMPFCSREASSATRLERSAADGSRHVRAFRMRSQLSCRALIIDASLLQCFAAVGIAA